MADTIRVSIELADAAAQKALSDFVTKGTNADKAFKKMGESGAKSFSDITVGIGKSIGAYEIFQGNLAANLVTKALESMAEVAHKAFDVFVVEGVKAAQESEDALNSLNVALGQSGNYSKEASDKFVAFAKSIQATTAYEDDAIIKNAALIQSMAGLSEGGLERATQAAVQLSAALGIDLETASTAIAKASNGTTSSIQKMGIQFQKAGTDAGTFENILAAVEQKFNGTAQSKINTYSGAIAQAKNNFGDLQEEIGGLIVQNPAVVGAIAEVSAIIRETSEDVGENKDAFTILVAEGFVGLIDATKYVVAAFDVMVSGIRIAYNLIMESTYALIAGVTGILSPFSDTMKEIFNATVQAGGDARKAVDDIFENGSFSNIQASLDRVRDSAAEGLNKLRTGSDSATESVKNTTGAVKGLSDAQKKAAEDNDKYVENLAKQADSSKNEYENKLQTLTAFYEKKDALDADSDIINYQAKIDRENEFYIAKSQLLQEHLESEQAKIAQSTVDPEVKAQADLAVHAKYYADVEKLQADHEARKASYQSKADKARETAQRDVLNVIATLQTQHNQTLATVGKAAAISTATIDGYLAAQKALSFFPPPFNFAAAAAVGVATAANIAGIAGVQFEQGGIVPGSSYSGDLVQARVNSGEMILNRQQQANLFEMAKGQSSGGSGVTREDLAAFARNIMSTPIVVEIEGRAIVGVFRDQLNSGRTV